MTDLNTLRASLNSGDNGIDDFMQARQIRMNYYAVCALEARVYLWLGNKAKALVCQARDRRQDAHRRQ